MSAPHRVIEALIGGQSEPQELAALAHGRIRATAAQLEAALRGRVTAHHRFVLKLHLDHLDAVDAAIARIDKEVDRRSSPFVPPWKGCVASLASAL
jgi:transposase